MVQTIGQDYAGSRNVRRDENRRQRQFQRDQRNQARTAEREQRDRIREQGRKPPRTPGRVESTVRGAANSKVGRGIGALAAPAAGVQTATTDTEDYYTRFGIEPKNDGTITGDLLPNIAIRGLGFASDLGNAMTFGQAGRFYRDKQEDASQQSPPGQPASSGQSGSGQRRPAPRPARTQAAGSGGQGISGGVQQFNMQNMRGGFAAGNPEPGQPSTLSRLRQQNNEREMRERTDAAALNQRRERSTRRDQARSTRRENEIERDNVMRMLRANANGGPGVSARMQREAQSLLANMAGGRPVPEVGAGQTPQDAQALAAGMQDAQQSGLAFNQDLLSGEMQNRQSAMQQQVMEQLQRIDELSPQQRRSLIDRALIAQGEDPDASATDRYMAVQGVTSPQDGGIPMEVDRLFDTQTGQFVEGGMQQGGGPGMSESEWIEAAAADPRNRGVSREELRAEFRRLYGQ